MNKITTYLAASFALIFSGSVFAGNSTDRQKDDVIYGHGVQESSMSQPFTGSYQKPKGLEGDLLYNMEDAQPSSGPFPYKRVENDRDNSQDLLYT